jgi:Glycosyl transferase family 2
MNVLFVVTRDEAELLRLNLAHHLAWGFDHVAIADNESTDATREVLNSFGDAVTAETIADPNDRFAALRRLVRRIEARHGQAQWVAVSDTDEFWWDAGGTLRDLMSRVPAIAIGLYSEQKLFLPTALDPSEGPPYVRRTWRTTGPSSPLHTSYRSGKSIYRASWVREHELTSPHWCFAVRGAAWRPPRALVHHYMINDENNFVQKVEALSRWSPQVRGSASDAMGATKGTKSQVRFGDFKTSWWRIYESGGERALREYFRTSYVISAAALPGHVERGELVQDIAFADWMRTR